MYKNIIPAFGVIFAVIGFVCVFSYILIRAVAPDKKKKFYIVSFFGEADRECSVCISCILSILTVLGLHRRCRIIAVDCGMKDIEKKNLLCAFRREDDVIVCSKEAFFSHVEETDGGCPLNGTSHTVK